MNKQDTTEGACPPTNCSLLVIQSNPHPRSDWHIVIEVEHQSFVLAYTAEDRQVANWMASMLQIALEKCGTRILPANAEATRRKL